MDDTPQFFNAFAEPARLLRAGELTYVWVPDPLHEAMRDLVRARHVAAQDAC